MSKNNTTGSSKSIQVVKSPADFMSVINNRWKIDWDLACTDQNNQYDNYLTETHSIQMAQTGVGETHTTQYRHELHQLLPGSFGVAWYGLSKNYLFLNPPFCSPEPACEPNCSKKKCIKRGEHNLTQQLGISKWMEKCKMESKRGAKIITLTLASIGSRWYKDHVEGNANIWILNGRLMFEGHTDLYPKDLMLCEWVDGMNSFGHLDWRKQIPASYRVEGKANVELIQKSLKALKIDPPSKSFEIIKDPKNFEITKKSLEILKSSRQIHNLNLFE